jgi:CheY-like chemotaxis protein
MEDNQPVIDLVSQTMSKLSKKCKHFLMLVNYVRELVTDGLISLQKVHTDLNLADVLTKRMTGRSFTSKAEQLLGIT